MVEEFVENIRKVIEDIKINKMLLTVKNNIKRSNCIRFCFNLNFRSLLNLEIFKTESLNPWIMKNEEYLITYLILYICF